MSVVANVAINVDSRGAVGQLKAVQTQAQLTERAFGGLQQAIGALGVGFALSKVISDVKELDTNLRRLTTVGVNVAKISPALAKLSDELGGVANKAELAAASYQAASAGFSDTAGNINILRAATKAAAGGLADTSAVTEVLVKTLNAYGMSGNQAIQVTDSISKAVELGNQEWSDYTSQLGRVASIAALAGVSLDEVNAFIASATKNGATAEIAFTGLGATLNTLLQPTKESQEAAAKLGLQWNYGALQAKGFAGLMAELAVATEKDKEATARLLGSQEAMRGAMAASSKGGTDFKNILEQLGNAAGKTDTDFQTMKGSLENTLKALDTSFKNLSEALGKAFGPTVVIAVQDITKAVNGFASIMNTIPQPVLNTTGEIIKLIAQMLLLQKAFQAIIGIRAAFIGAMVGMTGATSASGAAAKTSAGSMALYTNNTKTLAGQSAAATPLVAGLKNALQGLAAIGIITVGINLVTTGLSEFIAAQNEINILRGLREGGGVQLVGGATQTRENVVKMQKTAKKTVTQTTQQKAEAKKFDPVSFFLGPLAPLVGGKTHVQKADAFRLANEQQLNAQSILGLSPLAFQPAKPAKQELPTTTGGGVTPADGGGGKEPKEKKIKAAKEILDITSEEAKLQSQLILYTAQEDKYAQALLTKELAIYEAKNSQLGPNTKKVAMFKAEIDYTKTINDLEKEKTNRFKSQVDVFASQTSQINNQSEAFKLRNRLQMEGVKPELIEGELKLLETRQLLNAEITKLEESLAAGAINQEDYAKTINAVKLAAEGTAIAIQTYTAATVAAASPIQQFIGSAQTQLKDLESVAVRVSQGIGDAVGNSLTKGVQGLIEGTTTAKQVFADFLKSIGDILMQEGAKMIATYTAIAIARALAGLFGGGSSAIAGGGTYGGAASSSIFSAGTGTAFGGMSIPGFAEGGRPPVGRPSLVGEKGPELFVPSTAGTIIPADDTAAAMARYQRQGGGDDNEPDPVAAMARYQRQDGNFAGMSSNRNTTNNANNITNNGYNTNGSNTTNNGYNTAGGNTTNNGYNTDGDNTTNNGYNTDGNNTTNNGYNTAGGNSTTNNQSNTDGNNTTNNRNNTNGGNTTNNQNDSNSNSDTINNIQTSPSPVLSFSFETTRFLGQDYVSTDQLQAAMLATEKRAAASGAKAGAAQVAAQMRNSPGYRRQVGLR